MTTSQPSAHRHHQLFSEEERREREGRERGAGPRDEWGERERER
jgi:hypothetical protein